MADRDLLAAARSAPERLPRALAARGPMRTVHLPGDAPPAGEEEPPAPPSTPRPRRSRPRGIGHPEQDLLCACEWGPTTYCLYGDHHSCVAQVVETCETYITDADGHCVGHPPVEVWLADRTCTWQCNCSCHTPGPPAAPELELPGGWTQPALL